MFGRIVSKNDILYDDMMNLFCYVLDYNYNLHEIMNINLNDNCFQVITETDAYYIYVQKNPVVNKNYVEQYIGSFVTKYTSKERIFGSFHKVHKESYIKEKSTGNQYYIYNYIYSELDKCWIINLNPSGELYSKYEPSEHSAIYLTKEEAVNAE